MVMSTTISRPSEILVAFIDSTLLCKCASTQPGLLQRLADIAKPITSLAANGTDDRSFAEKPKVWKNFRWTGLGQKT
jgi:hypothetical protein